MPSTVTNATHRRSGIVADTFPTHDAVESRLMFP
jgi:hypothetical protein